jgi:hypothetical protein
VSLAVPDRRSKARPGHPNHNARRHLNRDTRDEPFKAGVAISAPRFLGFHPIGEVDGSGLDVACGNGAAGSPQQAALPAGDGGFWHGPTADLNGGAAISGSSPS